MIYYSYGGISHFFDNKVSMSATGRWMRSLSVLDTGTVLVWLMFLALTIQLIWTYWDVPNKSGTWIITGITWIGVSYDVAKRVLREYDRLAALESKPIEGAIHANS